jgi:hypothetical protein
MVMTQMNGSPANNEIGAPKQVYRKPLGAAIGTLICPGIGTIIGGIIGGMGGGFLVDILLS